MGTSGKLTMSAERRFLAIAAGAVLMLFAAVAAADDPEPGSGRSAKEEEVCRNVVPTGTRIPKKICLPASHWEQMSREGRKLLNHAQQRGKQFEKDS
jgi:hypothetical protein